MQCEINVQGFHPLKIDLRPLACDDFEIDNRAGADNIDIAHVKRENRLLSGDGLASNNGPRNLRFFDEGYTADTGIAIYIKAWEIIAHLAPDQLPGLSTYLVGPRRRVLATRPSLLYDSTRLMGRARRIAPGWFVDTNLSSDRKIWLIKKATAYLRLEYGRDIFLF